MDDVEHKAVASEVAAYAQVVSSLPLLVAVVLGARLLWDCAHPDRWEAKRRSIVDTLEALDGMLKDEEASAILKQRIFHHAGVDNSLLNEILETLLSRSMLHVCRHESGDSAAGDKPLQAAGCPEEGAANEKKGASEDEDGDVFAI